MAAISTKPIIEFLFIYNGEKIKRAKLVRIVKNVSIGQKLFLFLQSKQIQCFKLVLKFDFQMTSLNS